MLNVLEDATQLAQHVAEWLLETAMAKDGRFALCLSGGSTPKILYQLLANEPFRSEFPWERTHLFFGDERFVPPTHPDSNYRMVKEALLDHVPLPPANVHAFPTDGTPEEAARRYEVVLQAFYGTDKLDVAKPLFDVTLLGLGEDGHTASLFPGVAALDEHEAWAAAVIGAKPEPRLTLTYPALQSSGAVAFLVTGAAKEAMLARAMAGDKGIPAGRVKPKGELLWFADLAAAGE